MVVLCDVQHRRLSFRSVTRLSLVCSWSPPSTHQGSRVRQGYGVREAFWEPCSVARRAASASISDRSEEHTSELQSLTNLVCRLLLEKKKDQSTRLLYWPFNCSIWMRAFH